MMTNFGQAFTEGEMRRHPELFGPDRGIDRQTRERVVPMEVLNLGFMRTGQTCKSRHGFL